MSRKLTVRTVETIQPTAVRQEIPDKLLAGLYLIVQPSGAKSWAIRYRAPAGITRKHTLGSYPAISLEAARKLASAALRAVAEGRDPAQEKRDRVVAGTVAALVEEFLAKHVARKNKPRTQEETERLFRLHILPRWKNRLAASITRRHVIALLDEVAAETPIAANRVKAAVSKLFSWAVERDILPASPAVHVKPPSEENARERVLSDAELRAIWIAADKLGGPYGTLVKLLMLTGQRRSEVAGMRWSETDIDTTAPFGQPSTWIIPGARTKNGQLHTVPLSKASLAVLDSLERRGDFVMTTGGQTASNGYSKNKRALAALLPADMPSWWLHDQRRTLATGMAKLGIELPVIEKVLNHSSGSFAGIVGVYQRHDFADEKRAALEAWGRHIEALVSGKPAKVLPLLRV
jgi:integrase